MTKTMNDRPKNFYALYKVSNKPGPGSYDVFSNFNVNGYPDSHKKCKCGRRLGHPPVFDELSACKRNSKMMALSVDKKNKNLEYDW